MIKKKVLIIDDNLDVCREIKAALQNKVTDAGYALSLHDFFEQLKHPMVCLVIMDIHLKGTDGLELIKKILQMRPIPILVLSSPQNHSDRMDAFQAGAHGYMKKPYELEECIACARSLMNLYADLNIGKQKYYTLVFDNDFVIDPIRHRASLKGEYLNLTPKEFELLYYLASHAEQVLSREQIYNAVWVNDTAHSVDEVVKSQIKTLRRKLAPFGRDYIRNERGVGYRFTP